MIVWLLFASVCFAVVSGSWRNCRPAVVLCVSVLLCAFAQQVVVRVGLDGISFPFAGQAANICLTHLDKRNVLVVLRLQVHVYMRLQFCYTDPSHLWALMQSQNALVCCCRLEV